MPCDEITAKVVVSVDLEGTLTESRMMAEFARAEVRANKTSQGGARPVIVRSTPVTRASVMRSTRSSASQSSKGAAK